MKQDISNRADIERAVYLFYEELKKDESLVYFFTVVIPVNWNKHLKLMCDFWENVLFYTGDYEGNPLEAHRTINKRYPTTQEHFDRWIKLFDSTMDHHFRGPNVERMKVLAKSIADVMLQKIH
jgi:hemoglobin